MRIDIYFDEFIKSFSPKYDKDLRKTAKTLLKGNKEYCLPQRPGFEESEYLGDNIRDSVKMLPRGKDSAIKVYKRLVAFLRKKGIDISVSFPPIPIDSSFERQMFIAKYLQGEDAQTGDLERKLWVSNRTIDQDLQRLYRGSEDPIQVCGRPFFIPDSNRVKGRIRSASTAHPLFLTENLTQVIIMLKGLRMPRQAQRIFGSSCPTMQRSASILCLVSCCRMIWNGMKTWKRRMRVSIRNVSAA